MQFSQKAQFDGAFGDVLGRVFVPQNHSVGDAELGRQKTLVDDVLRMIGTHPPRPDRHARQRRIQAVEVEEERAKVATQQHRLPTRARTDEAERGGGGRENDTGLGLDHLSSTPTAKDVA